MTKTFKRIVFCFAIVASTAAQSNEVARSQLTNIGFITLTDKPCEHPSPLLPKNVRENSRYAYSDAGGLKIEGCWSSNENTVEILWYSPINDKSKYSIGIFRSVR